MGARLPQPRLPKELAAPAPTAIPTRGRRDASAGAQPPPELAGGRGKEQPARADPDKHVSCFSSLKNEALPLTCSSRGGAHRPQPRALPTPGSSEGARAHTALGRGAAASLLAQLPASHRAPRPPAEPPAGPVSQPAQTSRCPSQAPPPSPRLNAQKAKSNCYCRAVALRGSCRTQTLSPSTPLSQEGAAPGAGHIQNSSVRNCRTLGTRELQRDAVTARC